MRRSSIVITSVCAFVLFAFWGAVYSLSHFFPNSEDSLQRKSFQSTLTVTQDVYGVPSIEGEQLNDVLKAQGLVTARHRFFQMDLIRRKMAGELSELFGEKALPTDEMHRRLGFSQVADKASELMNPQTKLIWESFTQGVNDYLKNESLPWEVKVLGYSPKEWKVQDSLLVVLSMFESLNDFENGEELAYNELLHRFSKNAVDFLTWDFGFLDAPLKVVKGVSLQAKIPFRAEIDLRTQSKNDFKVEVSEKDVLGSNAWVVSGNRSSSGKPLLAGDPHLNLTVPNLWYRVELKSQDWNVRGVTVPGIPGVVIGRNGQLAWSFTNSRADVQDFIELEPQFSEDSVSGELGEFLKLKPRTETIKIKNSKDQVFSFWDSAWGPIVEEKLESGEVNKRILQWTALDPRPLAQLNPLELDRSQNLEQLWDSLSRWGGPVQNILVATEDNHIAWAMVGKIPDKRKADGKVSVPAREKTAWKSYIPWKEMPKVIDPPEGFIASGNQNMWIEGVANARWGHDWPSPARGFQIKKSLSENAAMNVESMESIQNEIYSPVHAWYRDRLVEAIKTAETQQKELNPWISEALNLIGNWDGRVSVDSAAYTFMKAFRLRVLANCASPFVARTAPFRHEQVTALIAKDSLVYTLLSQKPFHLLSPQFSSWEHLLIFSAEEAGKNLAKEPNQLRGLAWGEHNRLQAKHPFSSQLPSVLGRLINLPEKPLSGDGLVVRVSKPKNGASMRMVIDLADKSRSKFSQPGGQSGYFLSPHYQDMFDSWYAGKGLPFESAEVELKQVIGP